MFCTERLFSQNMFQVVKAERMHLITTDSGKNDTTSYYRIVASTDSFKISPTYPVSFKDEEIDTLNAIRDLLSFAGDKRICALPIRNYNRLRSQLYLGGIKNYSIQVEALFIINQLAFPDWYNYSSYPILVNSKNHVEAAISGPLVQEAYNAYKKWYKKLKKYGLTGMRLKKVKPLDETLVKWF